MSLHDFLTPELKKKMKFTAAFFVFLLLIIPGITLWYQYFYHYSEGSRTGTITKLSHKGGILGKTNEADLDISALKTGTSVWSVSIRDTNVLNDMTIAKHCGDEVEVSYVQTLKHLDFLQKTDYRATGVVVTNRNANPENPNCPRSKTAQNTPKK
ncbi:MAG: hypothetical protein HQL79_09175 [Magnetococcales bacterium]|nr:hypothetical protein [Magnetococcales bacterium]